MTPDWRTRRRDRRMTLVALLVLIAAIWTTNLQQTLNSRQGCQRGVASYRLNASNWRTAQQARQAAYDTLGLAFDRAAAVKYARNATSLERLAATDCRAAFPLPFPLHL